jgi:hypothetical protein
MRHRLVDGQQPLMIDRSPVAMPNARYSAHVVIS